MKKVLLVALMGLGAVHLNATNLTDEQFKWLLADCVKNKVSCQRLIDEGDLVSLEQCDKKSCNVTGLVYAGAEKYQQAIKYFNKACELSNELSCNMLAVSYKTGMGVRQDLSKAFKFYKKACDLNHASSCYSLGILHYKGQGTKQNFASAKRYYEKACNASNGDACNELGFLYANGQGVQINNSTAKKYFGRACDLGSQNGCDNYRILNNQGVN